MIALGLAFGVFATAGRAVYLNTRSSADHEALVARTYHGLVVIQGVLASLQEINAAQRGFVVTGRDDFLAPILPARHELATNLDSLRALGDEHPVRQRLAALEELIARRLAHADRAVAIRRREGAAAATALVGSGEGERLMNDIRARVAELQRAEEALLADRRAAAQRATTRSLRVLAVATTLAVALVMVLLVAAWRARDAMEARVIERTAQLAASERHFRDLADSAPVGIFRSTVQGDLTYANPAVIRLLGFDSFDAFRRDGAVNRWRSPEARQRFMQRLHRDGRVELFEGEVLTATGEPRDVLVSLSRLGDQLTGTLIDVTDKKRLERDLASQHRQVELLLNSVSEGIYGLDLDGRITFINPAGARLLGYEVEELVGRSMHELCHHTRADGRPHPREECDIYASLRDGQVHHSDSDVMWRKDGTRVVIEYTARPVFDEQARHTGSVVLFADLTSRLRTAEALRLSETNFRHMFDQAALGIALVDMSGHPVKTNAALQRILGYSQDELTAMPFTELTHPDHAGHDSALHGQLMDGRRDSYSLKTRYVRKDGRIVWANLAVSLIRNGAGTPEYAIAMVEDVTEQHLAEEKVRALNAELEARVRDRTRKLQEANAELETFSYSVSHDLRAPLRHIQGYAEMLADSMADDLPGPARRYLDTIRESSSEMGRLIDDLLALSRTSRTEMTAARVDLDTLVQESVRALEMETRGRNIEWRIGPLPAVLGDRALLRQALLNLVGNAVKYTRTRDPARIEIGVAGEEDGRVVVFVRDNGVGFDMQYAGKLFGVFQRLHRAEEFEGTGVGLAIARRVIGRHGGRSWAEGVVGRGATFYVTLQPAPAAARVGEAA